MQPNNDFIIRHSVSVINVRLTCHVPRYVIQAMAPKAQTSVKFSKY